jgi:hypothetical protein
MYKRKKGEPSTMYKRKKGETNQVDSSDALPRISYDFSVHSCIACNKSLYILVCWEGNGITIDVGKHLTAKKFAIISGHQLIKTVSSK